MNMDMLISLTQLPAMEPSSMHAARAGITVRRAMAFERHNVIQWVAENFSSGWVDECKVAFGRQPIGCHIAIKANKICGFCCVETTCLNFVGPIGVAESIRAKEIGRLLLVSCLQEMRTKGYAYAVAGDVGAQRFFERSVGAVPIQGGGHTVNSESLK